MSDVAPPGAADRSRTWELPGHVTHRHVPREPIDAVTPAGASHAVSGEVSDGASPQFAAVAGNVRATMSALNVPGAALGLLADGREEHAVFGVTSVESDVAVASETLFQIGSLTKPHTATAVMRLVDQGRLHVDATARSYLHDFRLSDESVATGVTLRHLLTHTGDWWGDMIVYNGDDDGAIARLLSQELPAAPQLAPLGSFFSYNNTGFVALGRISEVVTGRTYHDAMQELVLEPLGMGRSTFDRDAVSGRPHCEGHISEPKGAVVHRPLCLPENLDPAGGMWSTTTDVLRFARAHVGVGASKEVSPLLSEESRRAMQARHMKVPGQSADPSSLAMSLSWFVQELDGLRVIAHDGDTMGQHAEFLAIPDVEFAFVCLTNCQPGGKLLAQAALDTALAQYPRTVSLAGRVGMMRPALAPPDTRTIAVPPDVRAEYTGTYRQPYSTYTVRADGNQLICSTELTELGRQVMPDPAPAPVDVPITFMANDVGLMGPVRVPFLRRPDGSVGWLSLGFRVVPRTA